jgi:hypothetical protein
MKRVWLYFLLLFSRNFGYKNIKSNSQGLNEIEAANSFRHKLAVIEIIHHQLTGHKPYSANSE